MSLAHHVLQPPDWPRPRGYANGVAARGTQIFVAGMIGWDASQRLRDGGLIAQTQQALENIRAVLAQANARPEHMVRMTWYLTDIEDYHAQGPALGAAYRAVMGTNFPAMSAVQVTALAEPGAVVEIEVTAVVPD